MSQDFRTYKRRSQRRTALKCRSLSLVLSLFVLHLTCAGLTGCASCTRTTIPADVTIHITDPTFQRLSAVTSKIDVKASGTLREGRYSFRNVPLVVPADTSFTLTLSLPVQNDTTIAVGAATGQLTLSRSISIASVPAPQSVEIKSGQATIDVDFGRTLAAFLIDLFQKKESQLKGAKVQDILNTLQVDQASFRLRPDTALNLKTFKATIGENSTIAFANLKCDEHFNYNGDCAMTINLKSLAMLSQEDATTDEKRLQLTASATKLAMNFGLRRQADALTLTWKEGSSSSTKSVVSLADFLCGARNGTIFGARCDLQINSCLLTKRIDEEPVDIEMTGILELTEGALISKSPQRRIRATLPGLTTVNVAVNRNQNQSSWQVSSKQGIRATDLEWQIHTKDATVLLNLISADTSAFTLSSGKGLSVSLKQGNLVPSKLIWQSQGRSITANLRNAAMVLPKDVHFDINGSDVQTQDLKLSLKAPRIELRSGAQRMELRNLQGDVNLKTANDQINLTSKLSMMLKNSADTALPNVPLQIETVQLTATKSAIKASLENCKLSIATTSLAQVIRNSLPERKSFAVNKPVLQNRRWRYRNLNLSNVTLTHPSLSTLEFNENNLIDVEGGADVSASGTVERFQLGLNPSDEGQRGWKEHPWSAKGHVDGSGQVTFRIIPAGSLSETKLGYNLNLKMKVPEDLTVDWSKVAGDIPAKAEQAVLGAVVKHAALFSAEEGIPIISSGTMPLFKNGDARLKKLKVSTFKTNVNNGILTILFSAQASL